MGPRLGWCLFDQTVFVMCYRHWRICQYWSPFQPLPQGETVYDGALRRVIFFEVA